MALTQVLSVGGRSTIDVEIHTVTFDAASVAANISAAQNVTVVGVNSGDVVLSVVPPAALNAGLAVVNARVDADGVIATTFLNTTAGALDAASGSYIFVVARLS